MSIDRISDEVTSISLRKLLLLLDTLRTTDAGDLAYRQAEQILCEVQKESDTAQHAYAHLLTLLLDCLSETLEPESELRLPLKLLQVRLQPPLTSYEFDAIKSYFEELNSRVSEDASLSEDALHQTLLPLITSFGLSQPSQAESAVPESRPAEPSAPETTTGDDEQPPAPAPQEPEGKASNKADSIYRHHLTEQHKGIQKLEEELLQKIQLINGCHKRFGALMVKTLRNAREAETIGDLHQLRDLVMREAESMIQGNQILSDTLQGAFNYLEVLQRDSQRLTDELARVHLLSLTDELTGLPNRRAFTRHLNDEISRSERYGFPLSVAMIDLDHFKAINDCYGHSVGDAVLRNYAKNIFSVLRHHDIVSRYGGEEFAILLPNTEIEKALIALNKVLFRARKSRFLLEGASYNVPTISVGLTQYKHGEKVDNLISRADNTMYRAKELGRNRIVTDPHTELQAPDFRRQGKGESADVKFSNENDPVAWAPSKNSMANDH